MMISKMNRARTIALLGASLVLLWQILTVHFNYRDNWTALFSTGSERAVPPDLEAGTLRSPHPSGYDGQMYRYIAHDPFFQKGYSQYVDDPRLRYRRILVPVMAYALAFGHGPWIDYTFVAVVLTSIFAGCYWLARLFEQSGRSAWYGLLFLLIPAALASFDRMLVDATLLALFAGFLFYVRTGEMRAALILSLLALFTRETGVFLVLALLFTMRNWKPAAVLVLYGLWSVFVWTHTPASRAAELVVSVPILGHLQRLFTVREVPVPWQRPILMVTDSLAMVGLLASMALAVYLLRSEPIREVKICIWLFIGLGLLLSSPAHLEDPFGYARPVSPIFLYVVYRSITTNRLWWSIAPAAVTTGVSVYFVNPLLGIFSGKH